ncbi:MAG: hypothetical protein KDI55_25075 [Anaerolineae bacterium]|nr:hypothetical protein [Anaerolineae bacterium]
MPSKSDLDHNLFVDTLRVHTLEEIGAPYVIIGAFGGVVCRRLFRML